MIPDSDQQKFMIALGAFIGVGATMAYIGLLAAFTGIVDYEPWSTFLVSGETFLVIYGTGHVLVGTLFLHYAPEIAAVDEDSSTRVDA